MVCSMVKKGMLGAALSAGALYLVFGTSAPSYVRTAFHKVRHNVSDRIPDQFQIDRARDEIANLEPAIIENRETLARAEVDVEHLEREIAETRSNLASEKREILSLRDTFKNGDFRLAGRVTASDDEIRAALASRLDHYKACSQMIEEKEATLKARKKAVDAAKVQMLNLVSVKKQLLTRLETIEARLKLIEATQGKNKFTFDDSALSHAKKTVADLERRAEVKARVAEMEGRFSEGGVSILEPARDVVREIDDAFGSPAKGSEGRTADKSL